MGRARFRFMVMLGDGADILGVFVVAAAITVWPEVAGRFGQRAAQALQQAQAVAGHGQAAPWCPSCAASDTLPLCRSTVIIRETRDSAAFDVASATISPVTCAGATEDL
jgi:hypothetical protein